MLMRACFSLSALVLAACVGAAHAQPAGSTLPEDDAARAQALKAIAAQREAERSEIKAAREAIAHRRMAAEKQCYQRFAVEDCLSQVRAQAREQEQPLRARELAINDAERREKSSERLRSIDQKLKEPRVPQPVQATPRQPLMQPQPVEPTRTQEEIASERAQQQQEAQQRAARQQTQLQRHQEETSQRLQSEAERRQAAQSAAREREAEAARRREKRDKAVAERKAAPLPVPWEQGK